MRETVLERAAESYRRRKWSEAHQPFSLANQNQPLDAENLERVATSAYLIGRDVDFYGFLERAHHAHLERGAHRPAARCAFWLGFTLMLRGEPAQANGWLARAHRLVENHDCVERGYLLLPRAEQSLDARESDAALQAAHAAAVIGDRFRDNDLIACARHQEGRALMDQG